MRKVEATVTVNRANPNLSKIIDGLAKAHSLREYVTNVLDLGNSQFRVVLTSLSGRQ